MVIVVNICIVMFVISMIFFVISLINANLNHIKEIEGEMIKGLIGGVFVSFVIVILLLVVTTSRKIGIENINRTEEKLISMRFDNKVASEFLLGTGSINNTDYVVYYTKCGDEIVRNKKEASDIKIIEDKTNPKVITISSKKITTVSCIFGETVLKQSKTPEIEFHIPAKSIIENIKLN